MALPEPTSRGSPTVTTASSVSTLPDADGQYLPAPVKACPCGVTSDAAGGLFSSEWG